MREKCSLREASGSSPTISITPAPNRAEKMVMNFISKKTCVRNQTVRLAPDTSMCAGG